MSNYEQFEDAWEKFMVLCRAKLLEKGAQCHLSVSAAEMSVNAAAGAWFDKYGTCGHWLDELEKKEPSAAKEVKDILINIKLEAVPEKPAVSETSVIGAAAGGAALGAGIGAGLMHLGTLGTLLSAAVPAAALYPAMKNYQKEERNKADREMVDQYMTQVTILKDDILGVLARN